MNKSLVKPLEELATDYGEHLGEIYVNELHSGLYGAQAVRIYSQMTGRPHYIEKNLDRSIAKIKETGLSGTTSTNVLYDEPSGHAQYIADIKQIPVADAKTGHIENKTVLFHDNTWGPIEKEKLDNGKRGTWDDISGFERSDYNNGYGGSSGFILDKSRTGIPVENLKIDKGIANTNIPNSKKLHKLNHSEEYKYGIFNDIVQPGTSHKISRKYSEFISKIFDSENQSYIKTFDKILNDNPGIKINYEKMENLEKIAEAKYEAIKTFINGEGDKTIFTEEMASKLSDAEKLKVLGINSREAYEKLPENHNLKILLRKISLIDMPYGDFFDKEISKSQTHQELDTIEDKIVKENRSILSSMIKDSTFKGEIKSIDDIRNSIDSSEILINWIDNKYSPKTDEEFIKKFKHLRRMSLRRLGATIGTSSKKELGIKDFDGYNFIKRLREDNQKAKKSLNKAIFNNALNEDVDFYNKSTPIKKAENLYSKLYIQLSYLQENKQWDDVIFKRYGMRNAFPKFKTITEEDLVENINNTKNTLIENSEALNEIKNELRIKDLSIEINSALEATDLHSPNKIKTHITPLIKYLAEIYPKDALMKVDIQKLSTLPESEIKNNIKNIQEILSKVKQRYSLEEINKSRTNILKVTSQTLDVIAKAEICTKKQDKFKELTNELFASLMKDANQNSPKNAELLNKLEKMIREDSIFAHPQEILHNILKEAEKPNAVKIVHKNIMNNLKKMLKQITKIAALSELEYDIMDKTEHGYLQNFKKMMDKKYLVMTKTNKKFSMTSSKGVMQFLRKLSDAVNDDRTLKLFVNTLGLNENFAKTLINSSRLDLSKNDITKTFNQTIQYLKEFENIEKIVTEHTSKPITDGKTTLKSIIADINKKYPNSKSKEVIFYKKNLMKSSKILKKAKTADEVKRTFEVAVSRARKASGNFIKSNYTYINDSLLELQDSRELMDKIKVAESSKIFERSQKFNIELDKLINFTLKKVEYIKNLR